VGKMKKIHYMLENGFSEDKIAWYIFCNGRAGNWHKCKAIAKQMRNEYEEENNKTQTD
tara:strand:+ start:548 stop:721 length:174 start_codon:yes stop_codon:yes gene_type:complete